MALMLLGLFGLHHHDIVGSVSALIVMGISSLISGLWLLKKLHIQAVPADPDGLQRIAMEDHWRYGRWAMATGALSWAPGNVVFLLLPVWHGLEATGILRALNNLIMPALQINAALGMLLLPALVQARRFGRIRMMQIIRKATIFFTAGAFVYWLLIVFFGESAIALLYGSRYSEHASLLWLLGVLPIISALGMSAGGFLRAIERPDWVLRSYSVATALSLTFGVALVWVLGMTGAIIAMILTVISNSVILWAYLLMASKQVNLYASHT